MSKTLFSHYYPAWIAWSGIYCIVFSSLNWQPRLTFISLFIETQLQVLFVYLFIIWCFLLAERYCLSELMLREEKIDGLLQEKKLTQNEIRYLKARIDSEFLFEKLLKILELRDSDPQKAKSEQLDMVRTLRESLPKTLS